eukprot:COSAG01_NODE_920_length_12728_cov_38.396864_14_plen_200_part_00
MLIGTLPTPGATRRSSVHLAQQAAAVMGRRASSQTSYRCGWRCTGMTRMRSTELRVPCVPTWALAHASPPTAGDRDPSVRGINRQREPRGSVQGAAGTTHEGGSRARRVVPPCSCSQNGYLSSRGGCQNRWHSLVSCDHGDSTTGRFDSPEQPPQSSSPGREAAPATPAPAITTAGEWMAVHVTTAHGHPITCLTGCHS